MLIATIGYMGAGKDTVAGILVNEYNFEKDSFANSLKDSCASIFGWPRELLEGNTKESREWREQADTWWTEQLGIPNFTPRLALQLVGTQTFRHHFHPDIWLLSFEHRIKKNSHKNIVISDARFQNEIKALKKIGATIIRVDRGPMPEWYDIACRANLGEKEAQNILKEKYSHVHESEYAWAGTNPDIVINNNGTLEDLQSQVKLAINLLK